MLNLSVIGTTCIDIIKWSNIPYTFKSFGGIVYLITSLSCLFKDSANIYPVTRIEKKYYKKYIKLLEKYPNIKFEYIYSEPGRTNIVSLLYDIEHNHRCEKSFLGSTPINFSQIKPVLNFSDIVIVTYISGYDISLNTLETLRRNYTGMIYGDIHSFILTKSLKGIRKYKSIKNYERWIRNFNILQGSEIEWQVLLKDRFPSLTIDNFDKVAEYVLSLGVDKIIMTIGKKGVIGAEKVKNKVKIYNIPGRKIKKLKDTTGCGDTLTAGVIWGLITGKEFATALKIGNYLASFKAQKLGFFTQREMRLLLRNIRKY